MRYQQSDPDVRLMLRVKDDDAGAFEELVQRYQGRLVRPKQKINLMGQNRNRPQESEPQLIAGPPWQNAAINELVGVIRIAIGKRKVLDIWRSSFSEFVIAL